MESETSDTASAIFTVLAIAEVVGSVARALDIARRESQITEAQYQQIKGQYEQAKADRVDLVAQARAELAAAISPVAISVPSHTGAPVNVTVNLTAEDLARVMNSDPAPVEISAPEPPPPSGDAPGA